MSEQILVDKKLPSLNYPVQLWIDRRSMPYKDYTRHNISFCLKIEEVNTDIIFCASTSTTDYYAKDIYLGCHYIGKSD